MTESDKRRRRELARRRAAQQQRAVRGRADEEAAAERARRRTVARTAHRGWIYRGLFALAAAIAVQHLLAHSGWRPLPFTMGWQDLLIGYPTAAILGIGGLMIWGSSPGH